MKLSDLLLSDDPQVLFDTAVRGLTEQGAKAQEGKDLDSTIRYVTADGRKCAIGHCLNPAGHEFLGGQQACDTVVAVCVSLGEASGNEFHRVVISLQYAHDFSATRSELRSSLLGIARCRGINPGVLEQLMTEEWCKGPWC